MTHVIVEPGVCGLTADIKVEMLDMRTAKIDIQTDCKMVADLVQGLGETVDAFKLLGMSGGTPLLEKGRRGSRIHAACPTLAGVAKAVEAASQMALPRDASIKFVKD